MQKEQIKNITIIDTETGGLDPKKSSIIEIAAIFYNVPTHSIISQVSLLYPVDVNPAAHINKIDVATTQEVGHFVYFHAAKLIQAFLNDSDAIVAHNASFDQKFINEWTDLDTKDLPWICSCWGIQWSEKLNLKKRDLISLALAHKVPVWQQHRALTDCTYLAQIFSKYNGKLPALLSSGVS